MSDYLNEIVNFHNGNEFVRKKLHLIMPKILEYFGEQNVKTIVEAIRNIDVCMCPPDQDMERFISNRINISIDNYYNNYLNKDLINRSSAISYSFAADIVYDKGTDSIVNKGNDRKVIFLKDLPKGIGIKESTLKEAEQHMMKTLIHEYIVLIKSMQKNNIIRNNKRISRCGVLQAYSSISGDKKHLDLNFLTESGRGFNNASCEYDTMMIFASIYGYEPNICAYPLEVKFFKDIINKDNLLDDIHKYEINGDIPALRNVFDTKYYDGSFDKVISLFDKMMKANQRGDKNLIVKLQEEKDELLLSLNSDDTKTNKLV